MVAAHEERFTVRSYDLDARGGIALGAILGFVQETAGVHAQALGAGMARMLSEGMAWMLNRLVVELAEPIRGGVPPRVLHEEITVRTWPTGFERAYGQRDFTVRGADGRTIAKASSRWVIVALAERRATRIPEFIDAIPFERVPPQIADMPRLTAGMGRVDQTRTFEVRRSDLDFLEHVNNVRYAEWVVETVPDQVWRASHLARLDLHFRAEARQEDVVRSDLCAAEDETGEVVTFRHRLTRAKTEETLALATTSWALYRDQM
jgi:acyl-ACP thioesterase